MTLVLSLLLLSALMAAGIGTSVVIVNEFRTVSSTDQGLEAYYVADAGIERSLFIVSNNRLTGISPFGEMYNGSSYPGDKSVYDQVTGLVGPVSAPFVRPSNTVDLTETSILQQEKIVSLRTGTSVQLNFLNGRGIFESSSRGVPKMIIMQSDTINEAASPPAWAEVQFVYTRLSEKLGLRFPNSTTRLIHAVNLKNGVRIVLETGQVTSINVAEAIRNPEGVTPPIDVPSDLAGWTVRIRALYNDIPNLRVSACKVTDAAHCSEPWDSVGEISGYSSTRYPISNELALVSSGRSRNAQFKLFATVPWILPTSGIFDFVLFSEDSLDKLSS